MLASIAKQMAADLASVLNRDSSETPLNSPQLQTIIQGVINKCNLVSREEFDSQTAVLHRTRAKVDALEKQLLELENTITQQKKSGHDNNG